MARRARPPAGGGEGGPARVLESQSLILRGLGEEDIDKLLVFQNDHQLKKLTISWPLPVSRTKVRSWLEALSQADDEVAFGIVKKDINELIGVMRLMKIDWWHRKAELATYIGDPRYQDRGLGKEAWRVLLDWAFQDLGLHRVHARILSENSRTIRAVKSLGFQIEGTLREDIYQERRYKDVVVMGLLDSDYAKKRSQKSGR